MDKQLLKIKEPGLWEIQDGHLAFAGSLTDLIFIWWVKAFPGYSVNALTMSSPKKQKKKKKKKKDYVSLNIKF